MRLLLIDNHDSFTAVLHHYLWELTGERPLLYRNDELTRDELERLGFDAAVLSPGPGHPANVRDFGACADLLELFPAAPVLGVCLGMQGLIHHAGGRIIPRAGARHGRPSRIAHDGTGVFRGLPPDFEAIRYHSLIADAATLPSVLRVTARAADDDSIMGVTFTDRPWHGVQFHPESFATAHGKHLLANFLDLAFPERSRPAPPVAAAVSWPPPEASGEVSSVVPHTTLSWREPDEVFSAYFHDVSNTFWLEGKAWGAEVMGRGEAHAFADWNAWRAWADGWTARPQRTAPWEGYRGGPVGHLAYEGHRQTLRSPRDVALQAPRAEVPEPSRWIAPEGWFVFDRGAQVVHAAWEDGSPPAWLAAAIAAWDAPLAASSLATAALPPFAAWTPALDEAAHAARIVALQDAIARGETYEACLTHAYSVVTPAPVDAFAVFLRLRGRNPAPYMAWLAFDDVRILSASPELFLEARGGVVRSHPIKGTRRRTGEAAADRAARADLASSEKDAAENRMIVDLTRHDLARVCRPGSIEVPVFLRIEEHPAVYQLVSEVRGRLKPDATALDAIASCFPGGSMTGAPKERTVELLTGLEVAPRGVYSGALGYLAPGGEFTLSMVIRTLEQRGATWRTGCGGAVLADSDPSAEWNEATVKARSVIDAAGE